MRFWNLYFITKVFLYFGGYIGFHVLENLLFAVFLLLPIRARALSVARQVFAVPIGFGLLYYDSWLPSFDRVIEEWSQLVAFSNSYLLELVGRFVSWPLIGGLILISIVYYLLSRRFKFAPVALVLILSPLLPMKFLLADGDTLRDAQNVADAKELNAALDRFKQEQSSLVVNYPVPAKSDIPFDIIFLHICSLSWDDLKAINLADNPFFKRFDIVFTQFNSATAYSGPAMIRFQHSSCGQEPHDDMYDLASPPCHTLNALRTVGFQPQVALNHDGIYGHFLEEMKEIGGVTVKPMKLNGLSPKMYSFDDSPIYSDYEVLSKWWDARVRSRDKRAVLYYNTVTLHDGARRSKEYSKDSLADYKPRVENLFADLDRFFTKVEASGRRVAVVFLPEHGANLRGDKRQIAGMREIPSPTISIVPVGVKLIGLGNKQESSPLAVEQPSSYLAVTTLMSRFIAQDPYNATSMSMSRYTQNLPSTAHVAENGRDVLMMAYEGQYYLLMKNEAWTLYQP